MSSSDYEVDDQSEVAEDEEMRSIISDEPGQDSEEDGADDKSYKVALGNMPVVNHTRATSRRVSDLFERSSPQRDG